MMEGTTSTSTIKTISTIFHRKGDKAAMLRLKTLLIISVRLLGMFMARKFCQIVMSMNKIMGRHRLVLSMLR